MTKGKLLIASPEIILGLETGMGNLLRRGINFSNGGMAPVNAKYILGFLQEGTFDVYASIPKWESGLRELNDLTATETKMIEAAMPDNFYLINHASFNRVQVEGSNIRMYDDTHRFSSIDRALAFSNGVANTILPKVRPDIVWISDWMLGPVAPVAKAYGMKVVTTGHNIFTKRAQADRVIGAGIDIRNSGDYRPEEWIYWHRGDFDFMATAVNAADDFTTVSEGFLKRLLQGSLDYLSPTVTHAIRNKTLNTHLDGRPRVHGHLNPLDKDCSDLLTLINTHGLETTIRLRRRNSVEARRRTGLKQGGTLLIFPNRLYSQQKNPELVIDNAAELANKYDLRFLFLTGGDRGLEDHARNTSLSSNGLIAYHPFSKDLEELVKQSDNAYGVMTPNYEPCGGPNLNYPVEGTLIIGHAIDGVKDTVKELHVANSTGNGFPFETNDRQGLEYGIRQMKKFSALPEKMRYQHYIRIAQASLLEHSTTSRVKQLTKDIFLPLYEE
ncbi:glycogen/starch synthase [Candidatus Woesearchaeota archaeon]|nr:glycogen/starch synthase [Candidatus Woesearchaeota archaeon]